jgi:hypothetical protein
MAKRKFDDVPTESMFDDAAVESMRDEKTRPDRPKTIASGRCPECHNGRLGVVRQGEHLLWREHTYTTWSGARLTCRASGVATCVAPERVSRDYPMHIAILCPHTRDARERGD